MSRMQVVHRLNLAAERLTVPFGFTVTLASSMAVVSQRYTVTPVYLWLFCLGACGSHAFLRFLERAGTKGIRHGEGFSACPPMLVNVAPLLSFPIIVGTVNIALPPGLIYPLTSAVALLSYVASFAAIETVLDRISYRRVSRSKRGGLQREH